ncbi:MAG TPA: c-type cytochrome [Candidatus Limnocylindria bacterium]|nr:c-type cytochrome [Candidatus Limnocylindria bacterium]
MLRSIAELAAYGTLATLLTVASLAPAPTLTASSATTDTSAPSAPVETARVATDGVPTALQQRGALLFAAKGCIGCHTHSAFPNARMRVGPDLTSLASRAAERVPGLSADDYVRQSLREPSAYLAAGYTAEMPDLSLTEEQIESLTAFLLSPGR